MKVKQKDLEAISYFCMGAGAGVLAMGLVARQSIRKILRQSASYQERQHQAVMHAYGIATKYATKEELAEMQTYATFHAIATDLERDL